MVHKAMVTMVLCQSSTRAPQNVQGVSENTVALLFILSLCPQEHVFL